jgi:hypothetical protein
MSLKVQDMNPTTAQLQYLYRLTYQLTCIMFHPIHIIRIDERTGNLFILAGLDETIEFEITPQGELF